MSDPCSSLVNDDLLRDEDAKIQNASLCWMVKIVCLQPTLEFTFSFSSTGLLF